MAPDNALVGKEGVIGAVLVLFGRGQLRQALGRHAALAVAYSDQTRFALARVRPRIR
jgi:hypothetical protein